MKSLVVFALALALSGCASIFSGTTQEVVIRSTPGADYSVSNGADEKVADGKIDENSEAKLSLVRGAGYFRPHFYRMKLSKDGYKPQTVNIDPSLNPIYFGNILIGGFVGMVIVDPITGGMFRLIPERNSAELEKEK